MEFKLTKQEVDYIRGLFQPYLFYQKYQKKIECWCSRCDTHFFVENEDKTELAMALRCHVKHDEWTRCPRCGHPALAKAIGTARTCKKLWEEKRAVVLHRVSENRVEAMSFYCVKNYCGYSGYGNYTPTVQVSAFRWYDLRPRTVDIEEKGYYNDWHKVSSDAVEPFITKGGLFYFSHPDNSYHIIGLDKLRNSFLRYQQLELYANIRPVPIVSTDTYAMKYLCRFAVYPQIEMLQKMGYNQIVNRMVHGHKGNRQLNWRATKIHEFFKMTKAEYREFNRLIPKDDAVDFLLVRRKLGKLGYSTEMPQAKVLWKLVGREHYLALALKQCDDLNEDRQEMVDYLLMQAKKEKQSFDRTRITFFDYRRMAKRLKLGRSKAVRWPPHLTAAHDRAASMENALLMELEVKEHEKRMKSRAKEWAEQDLRRHDQDVAKEQKYTEQHQKNEKQYAYAASGFIIRVPATVQEIINEGRNQEHCVGGYAERHMNGTLTILFLRSADAPDKALYTIEMHDKRLTQVQGFRNRTPLTPEAKAFFDEWIAWVQAGSRRKKDGTPILPKEQRELKGA